jgi:hypothetical protein
MLLHVARQSFDVGQATDVTHVKVGVVPGRGIDERSVRLLASINLLPAREA